MKVLIFSPTASIDIDDIYNYTQETWGYEQAETYTFGLRDSCRTLATGGRIGRRIPGLKPGYLLLSYRSHWIIYRETDQQVIIARILHQRMNISRHL